MNDKVIYHNLFMNFFDHNIKLQNEIANPINKS